MGHRRDAGLSLDDIATLGQPWKGGAATTVVRADKGSKPTIVSIMVGVNAGPAAIDPIIAAMQEQCGREDKVEVLPHASLATHALALAFKAKKGATRFGQSYVLVSDADMVFLRMMGVTIVGHLSYDAFLKAQEHPAVAALNRARKATKQYRNRVNREYVETLAGVLEEIIQ